MNRLTLTPADITAALWWRLGKKFTIADHHWFWHGAIDSNGYGTLRVGGHTWKAHRLIYWLVKGPIPPELELDHLCRWSHCVRPDCLQPVTHRENVRRGIAGAVNQARYAGRTHCKVGHLLTERSQYVGLTEQGGLRRRCRICCAQQAREYRARQSGLR